MELTEHLIFPMLRLLAGLTLGLFIANLLEALRWTDTLAHIAHPFSRMAHLRDEAGASFALSFVSAASANALLSENLNAGKISRRELIFANLFNSLPAYFLHTPTIFFLTWPVLGLPAVTYVGLTLAAAGLRTLVTLFAARLVLPPLPRKQPDAVPQPAAPWGTRWRTATAKALKRFKRRLPKLVYFTVPVYILMFLLQTHGFFNSMEAWMAAHAHWLSFLKPEAMGIIVLHLMAELGAALGAASSILTAGGLDAPDVVLALFAGNILSTPMRALRHQLPSYAAYYAPRTALLLVLMNQALRAASLTLVAFLYYLSL